ncbi:MAG: AAA family ATPase [Patescibacteria group bacterium]|jgi:2-phosphoglycerate kinase
MTILICGQSGTGKTTLAKIMADKLNAVCISTDSIKLFARASGYGNAFTYTDSHGAWSKFGRKNRQNIIRGFKAHNRVLEQLITDIIKEADGISQHLIVEGVQITPKMLKELPGEKMAIYLDLPCKKTHFKIFDYKNSRRKIANTLWRANYDAIRLINDYTKDAYRRAGFSIIRSAPAELVADRLLTKIRI